MAFKKIIHTRYHRRAGIDGPYATLHVTRRPSNYNRPICRLALHGIDWLKHGSQVDISIDCETRRLMIEPGHSFNVSKQANTSTLQIFCTMMFSPDIPKGATEMLRITVAPYGPHVAAFLVLPPTVFKYVDPELCTEL